MNEPVAIVNTNCENNIQWYDDNPKKHNGYFLYTHPVKELTDEEISQVVLEMASQANGNAINFKKFARAILKKAQEK
jgi:hypothetical protein